MTVNGSTPNWLNPVPSGDVGHGPLPGDPQQWDVLSEDQLQQMRKQLLESVIASVVQAVQGLFVPGPFGAALEQLSEWANNLPTFEQVIQNTIVALAKVLQYPDPENATIVLLIDWVLDKFLGLVLPHRIPIVPISHLTNAQVNLLTNPMFTGSPFLPEESGEWVLDESVSQNGIGGSAQVTANGTPKSLLTVDLIPVTVGQELEVSAWIKTQDLVAGANSIVFGIAEYQTLDGSDAPTYRVLSRSSANGTTDWKKSTATYAAGLNAVTVRMFVEVRATATSGIVWFDNLFAGKKGLLEIAWVNGLSAEISNVWQEISKFLGLDKWQEFLDTITQQDGADIATFQEAWQNIQNQINENLAEAQQNWQQFTEQLANFLQLDKWDEFLEGAWVDLNNGIGDIWEGIEQAVLNFSNFLGLDDFAQFLANPSEYLTGMISFLQVSGVGGFANIGDAVQDSISNIQTTWDQWMIALTGVQNNTGSPELTAAQISELMATVVANATAIAQMQSQSQATNSGGIAGGDDFERPASADVTPGWGMWTADATGGKFSLDGHQAVWGERGKVNEVRYWRTDPKDAKTKTAYQSITRVNGTKVMQVALLPDLSGQRPSGVDTILGRVSDDGTQYVIALIDGDDVRLRYNLGAGERDFNPPAVARIGNPAAGTRCTLDCGDADGSTDALHTYRVLRNGAPILVYTDANDVTAPLDGNRGWGWGGKSGIALLGELSPSSVNAVTVADNPPTPTIGTYLRVYRSRSEGVKHPDGEAPLPANCMDFVQRNSIDLAWDQPTQTLVVAKPGPYSINARLEFTKEIVGVDRWDLLLYVKGVNDSNFVLVARGGQAAGAAGANADAVAGAFSYYFDAGDQVRLGIGNKGTGLAPEIEITGDAAGTQTWMTVTRGA